MAARRRLTKDQIDLTVGQLVDVKLDTGETHRTKVKRQPWQIASGQWLVGLQGFKGGYSLMRVRPVTTTTTTT